MSKMNKLKQMFIPLFFSRVLPFLRYKKDKTTMLYCSTNYNTVAKRRYVIATFLERTAISTIQTQGCDQALSSVQ
eukprot:1762134-Amphidinium_carterae.3